MKWEQDSGRQRWAFRRAELDLGEEGALREGNTHEDRIRVWAGQVGTWLNRGI